MNVDEINKSLSKLSSKELKSIKSQIDYFLLKKKSTLSLDAELLFNAIKKSIELEINNSIKSIYILIKNDKSLQTKLEITVDFLLTFLKKNDIVSLKKIERAKVYNLFADTLVSFIVNHTKMPLTLNVVLNIYEHFPALLDKAFPGYIKSGCLNFIVEQNNNTID